MAKCNICPRKCNVDRKDFKPGFCGVSGEGVYLSRAFLHFWEEECISGEKGSGMVFFSGCNLRCIYCQNHKISDCSVYKEVSILRLSQIYLELQEKGANNINLVTPSHYAYEIKESIINAKKNGLNIPVIYNSSGYDSVYELDILKDCIDVYLVDFKYINDDLSKKYSFATDYPEVVKMAIEKMYDNTKGVEFFENGLIKKGIIVRHLLLQGHVNEGKKILKYLFEKYGDDIYFSIMNQYTPIKDLSSINPNLNRRVTKREYENLINYALELGITNAYIQTGETALESFIPQFDFLGI